MPEVLPEREPPRVRWSKRLEYRLVNSHFQSIRESHKPKNATYANMPIHPAWEENPSLAAEWIATNLGPRPADDYQLHIIDRPIGFMLGNLAWVPRGGHKQDELVNRLLIENQQLRARITKLEKERSGT